MCSMKKILSKAFSNIKKEKSIFFSALVSLIMVFTIINIFIFGILNLNTYKIDRENSNQIIVYVKDLSDDEKSSFQSKLLLTPGILSLTYESKEIALKAAEKELGVNLSDEENPLNDAFYVYLTKDVNIEQLKNGLLSYGEIKEFDLRTKSIETSVEFSKNLNTFVWGAGIILAFFGTIMVYNLSALTIRSRIREIQEDLSNGEEPSCLKTSFFVESMITLILSMGISILFYEKIKSFLIQGLSVLNNEYKSLTFAENEILFSGLVLIITIIISLYVNYISMNKYYKGYVVNDDDEIFSDEEILENVFEEEVEELNKIEDSEKVEDMEEILEDIPGYEVEEEEE